jgi:hypothetical protein
LTSIVNDYRRLVEISPNYTHWYNITSAIDTWKSEIGHVARAYNREKGSGDSTGNSNLMAAYQYSTVVTSLEYNATVVRNDGNIACVPENTIALCTDKVSELRRDCMI